MGNNAVEGESNGGSEWPELTYHLTILGNENSGREAQQTAFNAISDKLVWNPQLVDWCFPRLVETFRKFIQQSANYSLRYWVIYFVVNYAFENEREDALDLLVADLCDPRRGDKVTYDMPFPTICTHTDDEQDDVPKLLSSFKARLAGRIPGIESSNPKGAARINYLLSQIDSRFEKLDRDLRDQNKKMERQWEEEANRSFEERVKTARPFIAFLDNLFDSNQDLPPDAYLEGLFASGVTHILIEHPYSSLSKYVPMLVKILAGVVDAFPGTVLAIDAPFSSPQEGEEPSVMTVLFENLKTKGLGVIRTGSNWDLRDSRRGDFASGDLWIDRQYDAIKPILARGARLIQFVGQSDCLQLKMGDGDSLLKRVYRDFPQTNRTLVALTTRPQWSLETDIFCTVQEACRGLRSFGLDVAGTPFAGCLWVLATNATGLVYLHREDEQLRPGIQPPAEINSNPIEVLVH